MTKLVQARLHPFLTVDQAQPNLLDPARDDGAALIKAIRNASKAHQRLVASGRSSVRPAGQASGGQAREQVVLRDAHGHPRLAAA